MSLPRCETFALTFTCGQLLITCMDIGLGSEVTFLWKISMNAGTTEQNIMQNIRHLMRRNLHATSSGT